MHKTLSDIWKRVILSKAEKVEYVEELFYLKEQYFTTQLYECKIFFSPNNYLIVIIMRVYHCCFSVQTTNTTPRPQS